MNCTIRVVKSKVLISFAVTGKLICAFVLAYADCWFSHAAAQLLSTTGPMWLDRVSKILAKQNSLTFYLIHIKFPYFIFVYFACNFLASGEARGTTPFVFFAKNHLKCNVKCFFFLLKHNSYSIIMQPLFFLSISFAIHKPVFSKFPDISLTFAENANSLTDVKIP